MRRKTGKAGGFSLDGTAIRITSWKASFTKKLADTTDTGDYDATTNQTWDSQAPGTAGMKFDVEGVFDLDATSAALCQKLKADPTVVAVFKFTPTDSYCSCNVDLSQVDVSSPVGDKISWTAQAQSNGPVTFL